MKNKKYILLIAFSIFFSGAFSQNSWHVSEYGDDNTGDGSESTPWATITKAMSENSVIDNDTIHVTGLITQDGDAEYGIQVLKDLVFKGVSKETSIIQAHNSYAYADRRVFTIWDVAEVKLINLTIRHGYFDAFSSQFGAGILNWGHLTLENCIVATNHCDNELLGGGIFNQFGTLIMNNTYVHSNFSVFGGAGMVTEGGTVTIENSSFALNFTQQNLSAGGGIYITDAANVSITNSTFYYNMLGENSFGGGICVIADDGDINLDILNTTIADNEAGIGSHGKGIFIDNQTTNSVNLTLKNCIVSNSNSGNFAQNGSGTITVNRTHTICKDESLPDGGTNGNLDNTDPLIVTFLDHGGLTPTSAIAETSPAINTGTDDGAPLTDQRGFARDGITDIGSYEYQSTVNININNKPNIVIYPNPARNYICIKLDNEIISSVNITDISGKTIHTTNSNENIINISNLAAGAYFLKIKTKNNVITSKFIKN